MGSFTNNLSRRLKHRRTLNEVNGGNGTIAKPWKNAGAQPMRFEVEDDDDVVVVKGKTRLVCCAFMRDGELHQGFQSHSELRRSLGDANPYESNPKDTYGFMTSEGEFVNRYRASFIAAEAGRAHASVAGMGRDFLSSDIDKW